MPRPDCEPDLGGDERVDLSYQAHVVGYYDQLAALPEHSSPNVIDVYIGNVHYTRMRW